MPIDGQIFELLVQSVKDYAVFILDAQGRVASWNAGAKILKGYEPEEIIGKHFSVFYSEEAKQTAWPDRELQMAIVRGRFEDEGWRVRKDGSRFWANVVITALREADGTLLGFSKITRDLTSRRNSEELLRQSEERFRLLIDGVVDYAIYMLDPEGIVTSWNVGAQRISGYSRDEVLGKHLAQFFTPEDIEAGVPWNEVASARAQGHFECEGWRVRKDGGRFMARVVVSAIHDRDGKLQGFAKVTQDLTSREHAQNLEQATRHITEFIAIMAHELRNPLGAIRNSVSVMARSRDDAQLHDRMLETIRRQSSHLTKIVDEMLDISRVTRGTLSISLHPVDLVEVIRQALEVVAPAMESTKHELQVDLPGHAIEVLGDSDRLVQVVVNLLTNAIRFTPTAGRIQVTAFVAEGEAAIRVSDSGRGIPAGELAGIFTMFVQGKEAINRVGGGLGVGLALSRRIAELHHGTIEACSEGAGLGSAFTLRVPVRSTVALRGPAKVQDLPADAERPLPHAVAHKRVLIVDDNEDAANALESLVKTLGHATCVANDGPTALASANSFHPDVVLLDIGIPGMNGLEIARQLRSRMQRAIRIIAVTGWGADHDRARSQEAGFDRHFVKPLDEKDLVTELAAAAPVA